MSELEEIKARHEKMLSLWTLPIGALPRLHKDRIELLHIIDEQSTRIVELEEKLKQRIIRRDREPMVVEDKL